MKKFNSSIPLLTIIPIIGISPVVFSATAADIPASVAPERIEQSIKPFLPKKEIAPDFEMQKEKEKKKGKKGGVKFKLDSIQIEGANTIPVDDLKKVYIKKLGTKITLAELRDIAQDLENYYRSKGYFLARLIIPPQKIKKESAKVNFIVLEGRISKVNIIGNASKSLNILRKYLDPVEQAPAITNQILEKALLLANDIPGITAKAVIAPSQTVQGAAEVNLRVEKANPNGFLSVDNRGTRHIGNKQLRVGGSLYHIASADNFYIDFQTAIPDHSQMQSFTGLYKVLVGGQGTSLTFTGKKTHTAPGLDLESDLGLQGRSNRAEVSVNHPIIRSRFKNWYVNAGFYMSDSRNDITLTNTVFYNDKVRAFYLGTNYTKINPKSTFSIDLKLTRGLDILTATKKRDESLKSRTPEGTAKFLKTNFTLSYIRNFGQNWSLALTATGQHASNSLLSGEEFGYGGETYGSAFDSSEITGDHGLIGKIELRYNMFPKIRDINYLQFFTAFDRGKVWNKGVSSQQKHASAQSVSAGVRFGLIQKVTGSVEVAQPMLRDTSADVSRKTRYFGKLVAKF